MFNPNTHSKLLQAVLVFTLTMNIANAGVGDSMESFWSGLGDNANYTQGGAYKSQTNTYYSGPSVYARSKVVSINPVSIQAPSLRGGCNGIDMFAGSFSHVNADQFINLLKQIPNNAKGFAFQLMLDTIAPSIATELKAILATIEKINAMNLNSCDIAAGAVGGAYGLLKTQKDNKTFCSTAQSMSGKATDWAKGINNCGIGGEANETNANNKDPDLENFNPTNINFAWEALKNSGLDNDLKEVFQSIAGTMIKQTVNNKEVFKAHPSKVKDDKYFDMLLTGGKVKIFKCIDGYEKCLSMSDGEIDLKPQNTLKQKVLDSLNGITEKLSSNSASLEPAEQGLVDKVSTIPIISMLKVKILNGGISKAKIENLSLSEIVAIELLYLYIGEVLNAVMQGADSSQKGGSDREKFVKGIKETIDFIERRRATNLQKLSLTNDVLKQIHEIEKIISQSSKSTIFN